MCVNRSMKLRPTDDRNGKGNANMLNRKNQVSRSGVAAKGAPAEKTEKSTPPMGYPWE